MTENVQFIKDSERLYSTTIGTSKYFIEVASMDGEDVDAPSADLLIHKEGLERSDCGNRLGVVSKILETAVISSYDSSIRRCVEYPCYFEIQDMQDILAIINAFFVKHPVKSVSFK